MLHLLKKKIKSFGFDIEEKKSIIKNMSYVSDLSSKQISAIKKENLFSMNNLENIKKTNYIIFVYQHFNKK